MALSIKNDEADRLARELARLTGESLTQAILVALRQRLDRARAAHGGPALAERLLRIGRECTAAPLLDQRSADEILGYDPHGLPG